MPPLHTYVKISSRGNRYHSPLELYSSIERKRGEERKKKEEESFVNLSRKFRLSFQRGTLREKSSLSFRKNFSLVCWGNTLSIKPRQRTATSWDRPSQSSNSLFLSSPFSLSLSFSPASSLTLKINIDFKRRRARDIFRKVSGLLS